MKFKFVFVWSVLIGFAHVNAQDLFLTFPNDSLDDQVAESLGGGLFGGIFDLFSAIIGEEMTKQPQVNFDYSGTDCLITVGGLEGFDPNNDSLTVRVQNEKGESGAVVTIVYTTTSTSLPEDQARGDSLELAPFGRRLRGGVNFRSESSHIIKLPDICSANDPSRSRYMSTDEGTLRIKFPKKESRQNDSTDDVTINVFPNKSDNDHESKSSPAADPGESERTKSSTPHTPQEAPSAPQEPLSSEIENESKTTASEPLEAVPLVADTQLKSPPTVTARRMGEWEMARAARDEF